MLSLHGFGGLKVPLCETYFAAKVRAFDTVFDQVFFVVNKAVHFALLGLLALMAAHIWLLTVTGRDMMPDINKTLTLNFMPTSYQQEAAESLNCLVDLMKNDPNLMDLKLAWEKLGLGEFSPQLNLLTEVIQENPPHEPVAEVLVDMDGKDELPGLEPIPDNEPPATAWTSVEAGPNLLATCIIYEHVMPAEWTQMNSPFSHACVALTAKHVPMHSGKKCFKHVAEACLKRNQVGNPIGTGVIQTSQLVYSGCTFWNHVSLWPKSTLCGCTLALMCNVS